ncbi:GL18123 [Drosophila persimilis]|uniref:GL18123 n=1 Tax=Drosophila persimilis TaxID=7234 RepID=B4HC26_DROPE|nr:GL18123 [Drosophila persimilis]
MRRLLRSWRCLLSWRRRRMKARLRRLAAAEPELEPEDPEDPEEEDDAVVVSEVEEATVVVAVEGATVVVAVDVAAVVLVAEELVVVLLLVEATVVEVPVAPPSRASRKQPEDREEENE